MQPQLKRTASKVVGQISRRLEKVSIERGSAGGAPRGTQIALVLAYQERQRAGMPPPLFADIEFRNTSQNGEDGILLFIFALAGMGNRKVAELCAGDGVECNAANLVLHFGWEALLVDGNATLIKKGGEFYGQHPETSRVAPILEHTWVTADGAQGLLEDRGFAEGLDLLSLDLDGNDYWVLEQLRVEPRVIICEYNNRIPAGEAVTVPYEEGFVAGGNLTHGEGYFGASLDAYTKLLEHRGYRLVGANRHNTNAFFLREDVLSDVLPVVPAVACLSSMWAQAQRERWWPTLRDRDWVRI